MESQEVKKIVREGYARLARRGSSCCVRPNSCCGSKDLSQDLARKIGYTAEDLKALAEGGSLSLGCGNPIALASLREGETVLDLGSGAGFDCLLAAGKVGKSGRIIGVDITPEMIERAREDAKKGNYRNVEFRLADIENLPVADNSVDVVISNCVINLSPDKRRVFQEAFRVLRPGGRMMISDIVLLKELPDFIKSSIEAYIGCLSGAIMREEYLETMKAAGFQEVRIIDETSLPVDSMTNDPVAKTIIEDRKVPPEKLREMASSVISITVYAAKPKETI